VCVGGVQTCLEDGTFDDVCVGEVVPSAEVCGNGLDDNCDSQVDEECPCNPGDIVSCYNGPAGTAGVGICKSGTQTCDADGTGFGPCTGETLPGVETCDAQGMDEDCDGVANEVCVCTPGSTQSCYTGPQGTEGVGLCAQGTQTCAPDGLSWNACVGDITPSQEVCDGQDNDCDGVADNIPIVALTTIPDAFEPKIAVGSDGTLGFVWVMKTQGQQDKALFGTADGNGNRVIGDTPLPPEVPVANGYTRAPAIVANGMTFAATYTNGSKGHEVRFATIDQNGVIAASLNTVNGGGTGTAETSITTDGTVYFAAWDDVSNSPGAQPTIYQGVWNNAGALVGGSAVTNVVFPTMNAQAMARAGGGFTTCWRQDVNGSTVAYCRDYGTNGVAQGMVYQLALGTIYDLRIGETAAGPTTAWRASNPSAVYFAQFNAAFASPITSLIYSQQGVSVDTMDYAWNGSTHTFAFVTTTGQDHTVSVITRDGNGVLSAAIPLSTWQGSVGDIRVEWDAPHSQFVVVWDADTPTGRKIMRSAVCDV
jgi:hypothetical protein